MCNAQRKDGKRNEFEKAKREKKKKVKRVPTLKGKTNKQIKAGKIEPVRNAKRRDKLTDPSENETNKNGNVMLHEREAN